MPMLTPEQALEIILGHVHPLTPVARPILETAGCVLAQDLHASEDLPPWPNSAMDGYAVRAGDVVSASRQSPVRLRVLGQIGAGQVFDGPVGHGEALKVMTGAPVPAGADSVVMVEETDGAATGEVAIYRPTVVGEHIRPCGEEVHAGELVLHRGTTLRPAEIGMCAALGHPHVWVHERPRVAVLATGDELVEPGTPLGPGQIRNSNSYALLAQVASAGAIPDSLGTAPDQPAVLYDKMRAWLDRAHVLLTSGGVSMGEFDYVASVMERLSARILFDCVAMAPGKPTTFAVAGERIIFGLPGNPVSSMVAFELFVRPALRRLAGHERLHRPQVRAILTAPIRKRPGRRQYLRCSLCRDASGRMLLTPTGTQSSGVLLSMSLANALAIVEAEVEAVAAGTELPALLLDFPESAIIPGV